ncbi:MAG: serine/threonine-protein kinase [Myxococcaceae bacterium]
MGRPFGRYELLAKIAQGGMAEVFLAVQRGPGGFEKLVAIKQLLPELVEEPGFVEGFQDEARIAAVLSHPNICQTFELGQEAGRYFIAMEYLAGVPLSRLWKKSLKDQTPLPASLAAWAVARAAEGLAHAHQVTTPDGRPLHVVHRDVSPDNIVVTWEGLVKVVDFGIAKAANRQQRTRTGVVKGKLSYMAPEQALGQPVDGRADVYSLGAVLYEVLAHEPMLRGENDIETMRRIVEGKRPVLSGRSGIPAALSRAVEQATAHSANERPTADQFAERLTEAIRKLEPLPSQEALARHIQKVFAVERAEEQARLKTAAAPDLEDFLFSAPPRVNEELSASTLEVAPQRPGTRQLGAPETRTAPRRRWPLIAGAVTVALALGGFGVSRLNHVEPPPPAPQPVAAAPVEPPPPPVATPEPPPAPPLVESTPAPKPAPRPAAPVKTARKPAKVEVPAESGTGKLTFDTVPWTDVFLGSRKIGTTPLVEVELPAGPLKLRLVNPQAQIDRRYDVVIRANQVVTLPRTKL